MMSGADAAEPSLEAYSKLKSRSARVLMRLQGQAGLKRKVNRSLSCLIRVRWEVWQAPQPSRTAGGAMWPRPGALAPGTRSRRIHRRSSTVAQWHGTGDGSVSRRYRGGCGGAFGQTEGGGGIKNQSIASPKQGKLILHIPGSRFICFSCFFLWKGVRLESIFNHFPLNCLFHSNLKRTGRRYRRISYAGLQRA